MGTAKVQFKINNIEFSGEGEDSWVATQLDKIIQNAPHLLKNSALPNEDSNDSGRKDDNQESDFGSLVSYLKSNSKVGTNQAKRFLATAFWLSKGRKEQVSTSDVTKALRENHQTKLSNASECLNSNVRQGYCVKEGNKFYITSEGIEALK